MPLSSDVSDNKAYFNADGDFVPAKNTVTVTFAAGANLVASQGWVEVEKDVYKYVITTKANDTAGLDNKADIVISKIVTKAWGVNDPINTFKFTKKLSIVTSGGFGTMGFGLPAAIGATFGAPDRTRLYVHALLCHRLMSLREPAFL